jgi:predicted GIY-YIG superfamily endonuclease
MVRPVHDGDLRFDLGRWSGAHVVESEEGSMIAYVYGLYEGFKNIPFYIGVTEYPKRRLWAHKAALDGKRQDSLTGCGVKSVDVTMRLLANCDDRAHAEVIEKALINFYHLAIVNKKAYFKPHGT